MQKLLDAGRLQGELAWEWQGMRMVQAMMIMITTMTTITLIIARSPLTFVSASPPHRMLSATSLALASRTASHVGNAALSEANARPELTSVVF